MSTLMKYKALMLDFDGTTAVSSLTAKPTTRVKAAILEANKKIHVGIATGRPYPYIKDILKDLAISGPCIVNDGAMVINASTKEIYYERSIDISLIPRIIAILKEQAISFSLHDSGRDVKYSSRYIPKKPTSIFTIGADEIYTDAAYQKLIRLPSLHVTKYVSWANGLPGILTTHAEATKQHGIMEVAKALGISTHEIIGVGDGYNDFPLLMACGLKVAMGNAVPELKAIADYIAPTVEEDGVADVIEKFILNTPLRSS